jgi:hypothetical protein
VNHEIRTPPLEVEVDHDANWPSLEAGIQDCASEPTGGFTGIVLAASDGEGIRRAFFNANHVE